MLYWEIWGKFSDAASMFWQSLAYTERAVVIYLSAAVLMFLLRSLYRSFIGAVAGARPVVVVTPAPEPEPE